MFRFQGHAFGCGELRVSLGGLRGDCVYFFRLLLMVGRLGDGG